MEYISIDIETTGLDRENDQVLEIGAIIENTHDPKPFNELPKFHAIIQHERYSGSEFAIHMNSRIFKILANQPRTVEERTEYCVRHNIQDVNNIAMDFYYWCMQNLMYKPSNNQTPVKSVVAGKNFVDFDKPFLNRIPDWTKYFQFHRRVLDPAILFWKPTVDYELPNLSTCLERAGIEDTVVTHNAIEDAWQVIQVLRTKYKMPF